MENLYLTRGYIQFLTLISASEFGHIFAKMYKAVKQEPRKTCNTTQQIIGRPGFENHPKFKPFFLEELARRLYLEIGSS